MLLHIIDTETGGLSMDDPILTLGIVSMAETGRVVKAKEYKLYQPGYVNNAAHINHIDMREHAKYEDQFEDNLKEIFIQLNGSSWIAHNMKFDYPRVAKLFRDQGTPIIPNELYCSMKLCGLYLPRGSRKLMDYMTWAKVPEDYVGEQIKKFAPDEANGLHNALFDALSTYYCILRTPNMVPLDWRTLNVSCRL